MKKTYTFTCVGMAALILSGCSLPQYDVAEPEVKPAQLKAPVVVTPKPVAAPVQTQATVQAPVEEEPKPRWAHVPIGNTLNTEDGDEDGGWSG